MSSKKSLHLQIASIFLICVALSTNAAAAQNNQTTEASAPQKKPKYQPVRPVNATVKPIDSKVAPDSASRIILLGTSAGPPLNTLRSQPATLLVVDGTPYLIDAGAGIVHQLDLAGFQPEQVRTIFITHNHLDHNAGLEPFMSESWLMGNLNGGGIDIKTAPKVTIYGPKGTKTVFDAAMKYMSVSARIFDSDLGAGHLKMPPEIFSEHTVKHDGVIYNNGKVKVTAAENTHFHFNPGTPAYKAGDRSYAYRFDTPQGSVVFTGDTGPSRAVTKLANNADVLISEVMSDREVKQAIVSGHLSHISEKAKKSLMWHMVHEHLTPEDVGKMAQKAHVKTVILHHIGPNKQKYRNATTYTAGVKKYFDGTVILGRDLMEYDVFK